MEIYEKINYLVEESNMTKKEFVDKVLELEPKMKNTGEIPSIQTIYRYLNGSRELKVEILPYFAEVLGVKEQEFFESDIEYATCNNIKQSKEVREILNLLQYLPTKAIKDLKDRLYEYRKLYEKGLI
ncbi:hypothetical protein [Aliarcobacter cryaerophilus]|uniref:hypothetical protein n=1 Tax=Aliarcobacter cryaerophilus TaxID=28198 RepID=UPI0021B4E7D5|nr:hypothetical protein [Aliarcobacter cryaerophilus]MCT7406327.1 hypothetical protein [Aliarcobacter cryaerophilus]MCT7504174.1 hypothetical protein [Aliarcobacter cryaerophilus]